MYGDERYFQIYHVSHNRVCAPRGDVEISISTERIQWGLGNSGSLTVVGFPRSTWTERCGGIRGYSTAKKPQSVAEWGLYTCSVREETVKAGTCSIGKKLGFVGTLMSRSRNAHFAGVRGLAG